jgi:hypothetical protein
MVHRTFDKGTWSNWETLDAAGSQENKVDVSSWGGGRLDVFAQGYENAFWHRSFEGKWSDWEQLDGKIAGDPAAVSRKKDSVDILANSLAGTAVGTSWNGTEWGDWEEEQLPTDAEKGFAINSWNEGRMDVLVRTKKGEIWHQSSEGKWTPWKRVGGQLSSLPGLYAPKVGTLVAIGAQGDQLVMNKYEGIWSGWDVLK